MSILYPTIAVKQVTDITPEMIRKLKVKAMILDVDNTLSRHGCPIPFEGSIQWTHDMRSAGIKIIIVSNNHEKRVASFSAKYDLPYIYRAFKPLSTGYVRAMKHLGVKRNEIVVVGDQIFTDILGANFAKMKSILLTPKESEHSITFKIRRSIEAPIRRNIAQKGIYLPTSKKEGASS